MMSTEKPRHPVSRVFDSGRPDSGADLEFSEMSEAAGLEDVGEDEVVFAEADPELLEEELVADGADVVKPGWFGQGRRASNGAAASAATVAARPRSAVPASTRPRASAGQRPKAIPRAAAQGPGFPALAERDHREEHPWPRRLLLWFASFAAMGYGFSLIFHLLVLTGLVFVAVAPNGGGGGPVSLTAGFGDWEGPAGFDEFGMDDEEGGKEAGPVDLAPLALDIARDSFQESQGLNGPELPESVTDVIAGAAGGGAGGEGGAGNGSGKGVGDGKGLPFRLPGGGAKVARKGRFSAWTVPADPEPGQNYIIVIQIELPENMKKLARKDLLGSLVIGTDGYKQFIPGNTRGFLPGNEQQVQVAVSVPGAATLVRDTIKIKSKALKEEQTLESEF
jgi:hypothetical protein